MINRRVVRPSRAVEQLQQLCLNNSAGIDCTRPHSDVKSVYGSKNLVVNTDGSVSLRKPLVLRTKFNSNITRVIPISNEMYVAIGTYPDLGEGFLLLNSRLESSDYVLLWHDSVGNQRIHNVPKDTIIPSSLLDLTDCTSVDTMGAYVLSNCLLSKDADVFPGNKSAEDLSGDVYYPIYVSSLYGDSVSRIPSYLQIYKDTGRWCVRIHVPMPNVYSVESSGDVTHNMNTVLTNPYAVSDTYNSAVPSTKVIRPYVFSEKTESGYVLKGTVGEFSQQYPENVSVDIPSGDFDTLLDNETDSYSVFTSSYDCTFTRSSNEITWNLDLCMRLNYSFAKRDSGGAFEGPSFELHAAEIDAYETASGNFFDRTDALLTVPTHTVSIPISLEYFDIGAYNGSGGLVTVYSGTVSVQFLESEYNTEYRCVGEVSNIVGNDGSTFSTLDEFFETAVRKSSEYAFSIFATSGLGLYASKVEADIQLNAKWKSQEVTSNPVNIAVRELTESAALVRYRAANSFATPDTSVVLKAFLNFPKQTFEQLYCSWRYSTDGIVWYDALLEETYPNSVLVEEPSYEPIKDVVDVPKDSNSSESSERSYVFAPLNYTSSSDIVTDRADCLNLDLSNNLFEEASVFMFKLCTLHSDSNTVKGTYGTMLYYPVIGDLELEDYDLETSALGNKLYSNSRIYSYGAPFKNNVLYSYPKEFETPIKNTITLGSSADSAATALVRWRDSLICATESALYLIQQQSDVFFTKVLNTAIGIPSEDGRCCVPILNGVLFKSGSKVYQLYPNLYSDDGSVLNVTDVSQSIAHYLEEWATVRRDNNAFAFSTESEYVLMLPKERYTVCLRYNYATRVWTAHEYPAVFKDVSRITLDDIRVWGSFPDSTDVCEFVLDAVFNKIATNLSTETVQNMPYGDILVHECSANDTAYGTTVECAKDAIVHCTSGNTDRMTPINFELDTGQKTDAILTTKQFVESKLVFSTLNVNDAFPMNLVIHVDGDPHLVTRDISTDASFWKDGATGGVLNTTFGGLSSTSDSFNTLRQLVVRYSGKGKSVRHVLTGNSLCNFKLYETYIRYKLLNVKQ